MNRALTNLTTAAAIALALAGCGKFKQKGTADPAQSSADSKRQKIACASPAAYDHVKGAIFDQAIRARGGDRANLDMLADYSQARMDKPMVDSRDAALDLTRCTGHFVLDIPPGAERGLGGQRRLESNIDYSAQAAADGSGLVYRVDGAEPIVQRLAAFNLAGVAYRPPPAIDTPGADTSGGTIAQNEPPPQPPVTAGPPASQQRPVPLPRAPAPLPRTPAPLPRTPAPLPPRAPEPAPRETRPAAPAAAGGGDATVRAFYIALGEGNGAAASAQIVPEKRSGRAYSPAAISQFYGRLPEPLRLTGIVPLSVGTYRVSYRYSAGRSHCNGSAIVRTTNRSGRNLISSIRSLSGC